MYLKHTFLLIFDIRSNNLLIIPILAYNIKVSEVVLVVISEYLWLFLLILEWIIYSLLVTFR